MSPTETIVDFDANPRNYPWPAEASLMEEIRENWRFDEEAERQWRPGCADDLRFSLGEIEGVSTQWDPADVDARASLGTPTITMNRAQQFIRQVDNEGRRNPKSIRVIPVDDSDLEDAEIRQGLIRSIESRSNADIARACARKHMITMGIGYTRITTEWCDFDSFDQELIIDRVLNPFSVYFDRGAQKPDYSDAQHCSIHGRITKREHERLWPGKGIASYDLLRGEGDSSWLLGEDILRIAEYFRIAFRKRKLMAIANFMGGEDTVVGFADEFAEQVGRDGLDEHRSLGLIVKERDVQIPQVEWYKVNGAQVLEKRLWPGRWLPVVPWIGDEEMLDGRRHISGMMRSAKPAVQMYNFWISAITELVGMLPKSNWVATPAQIKGFEAMYEAAHRRNFPVMFYNAVLGPDGVSTLPPPARSGGVDPRFTAITSALVQADRDMKAVFGIYDAALGERGPQESGSAIRARQAESNTAWLHMHDNESRSLRFEGKIILDSIPRVYSAPRIERITMPDQSSKAVALNQPTTYKGKPREFNMLAGKYDVQVTSGPAYQTQREEATTKLLELVKVIPPEQAAVLTPDIVRNIDMPNAVEVAKKTEQVLPAHLRTPEEGEQQIPPEVQAALAEAQARIQELEAALEGAAQKIESKEAETSSRERIAAMQLESQEAITQIVEANKAAIAEQNNEVKLAIAGLQESVAELNARVETMKLDAGATEAARDRSHGSEEAEREREHGAEQADEDRRLAAQASKRDTGKK